MSTPPQIQRNALGTETPDPAAMQGLGRFLAALRGQRKRPGATVRVKGQDIRLSDVEINALRNALATVVPAQETLATGEAARLLNVSQTYLDKVLRHGDIPYTLVGRHRRIALDALMAYKARRDAATDKGLDDLIALSEDLGLYEREAKAASGTPRG